MAPGLSARSHLVPNMRTFRAFIGLQLVGAVGFTLLILTALLVHKVKRYPTWYSFCVSWIISCLSYCLLAFAGEQDNPTPKPTICVAQAALIYAAPVLTGCTTCALSIQMFLTTRCIVSLGDRHKMGLISNVCLIMIPYWLWMAMFSAVLTYGVLYPHHIVRSVNWNYCDVISATPSKIAALIDVITCIIAIIIQVFIVRILFKNRKVIAGSVISLTMTFRVMFFTFAGGLGFVVSVVYVLSWKPGAEFDIVLAIIPVLALMIFGSQLDLMRSWLFWKTRDSDT